MKELDHLLGSLEKSMKNRLELNKKENKQKGYEKTDNLIRLPLWPEAVRGVPNSVLRGSLFAAIPERSAKYCDDLVLHKGEKITIKYTGKRLTQSDLNVWEYALHLSRNQCLGNKFYFTERSFLKALGKTDGTANYKWLDKVFKKLRACAVAVSHGEFTYIGGLIDEAYRDDGEGKYALVINHKLARLFEAGNTWLSWDERKLIGKRKPLAQWFHGYVSTHAKWYPHKVKTLKDLSGSETKELWKFKQNLVIALKHLQNLNLINSFFIDSQELVHIDRTPSKSQQDSLKK